MRYKRKKEAYIEMTKSPTEERRNECMRLKKAAYRADARGMKEAVRKINEIGRNPNKDF